MLAQCRYSTVRASLCALFRIFKRGFPNTQYNDPPYIYFPPVVIASPEQEVVATESRPPMASTHALPSTKIDLEQYVHMLLVLRSKHGVFVLQLVELRVSDSGTLAMEKLRERLDQERALKSKITLALLCRRMTVEIAEISLVSDEFRPCLSQVLTVSTAAIT